MNGEGGTHTVALTPREIRDIVIALGRSAGDYTGPTHGQLIALALRLNKIVNNR